MDPGGCLRELEAPNGREQPRLRACAGNAKQEGDPQDEGSSDA